MRRLQRILVLTHWKNAVGDLEVLAREDQMHAGMRERAARIDSDDSRVRNGRAQQLTMQHARQHDVVSKLRLAGDLGPAIDATTRLADQAQLGVAHCCAFSWLVNGTSRSASARWAPASIAASTASKIC